MNSEHAVAVQSVTKRYDGVCAVDDLSFAVRHGEIFGLLGPNGAGKTSTIRMLLDIIKPTAGHISVLGGPMTEAKKARIGYLPEERGLYDDMTVQETLVFLGRLKGLERAEAVRRAERYLREVELWDAHAKKIAELSRGMRQKAQFVAATLHEPDLIIIDEPFSGLDPVNARIIKRLLTGMRERGVAIIMSTHQMHEVEALCDRILLINRGQRVLYGPVDEIRRRFATNAVQVEIEGALPDLAEVVQVARDNGTHRLVLREGAQPANVLEELVRAPEVRVKRFEQDETALEDIFVRVVAGK